MPQAWKKISSLHITDKKISIQILREYPENSYSSLEKETIQQNRRGNLKL